jgi:hypothetical protein
MADNKKQIERRTSAPAQPAACWGSATVGRCAAPASLPTVNPVSAGRFPVLRMPKSAFQGLDS